MEQNYIISITGKMEQDGEQDTVQLMTLGHFVQKKGNYFISYHETQATGYEGNLTTVKVEQEQKVSMIRSGTAPSQLVIERGRRHVCHYDSGYGVLNLGVSADEITSTLTEHGGDVFFSYTLDTGNTQVSHNSVTIHVQEAENNNE